MCFILEPKIHYLEQKRLILLVEFKDICSKIYFMKSEKIIDSLIHNNHLVLAKPIDDIAGPLLLGLLGYLIIIIGISFPAFLFRNKVLKFGQFEGKNRSNFIEAFGMPSSTSQIGNDTKLLVWIRGYGNYLLKLKFDSSDNFIGIDTQLDQTQSGIKGVVYKLFSLFIK